MQDDTSLLLLLGGADAAQGFRCIKQAREHGLRVWLTDTAENLEREPSIVALANKVSVLPYQDVDRCVAWAIEQARSTTFCGVFAFRELAVEAMAAVAQALGLPGNTLEAVQRVRNKFACRQWLQEHGIHQPMSALCSNLQQAVEFTQLTSPGSWVVKPIASLGSVGVSFVQDVSDLEQALNHLTHAETDLATFLEKQGVAKNTSQQQPFLIECFQKGEEFSAEGHFVYGTPYVLALTAKTTTGGPHFVEVGHSMPAELSTEEEQRVKDTITAALKCLDIHWGIFHIEFWLDEGQPVLGEVHVRPGGDFIHYMTEHITGVDFYGALFDQFLNKPLDPATWRPQRGAAMRYLTPQAGQVRAIRGWDEVAADPDCLVAVLTMREGDVIPPLRSYLDRTSFIVTTGATRSMAAQTAERLYAQVKVDVE